MSWLKRKVEHLLTYRAKTLGIPQGETWFVRGGGRQPRFILILLIEHAKWVSFFVAYGFLLFVIAAAGFNEFFARLGAVTVLIGIVFGRLCVRKINDELSVQLDVAILKNSAVIAQAAATSDESRLRRIVGDTSSFVSEIEIRRVVSSLRAQANRQIRSFEQLEFILAAFGTIQWAFGDILVKRVFGS